MEYGIFENMSHRDYRAIPAVSCSELSRFGESTPRKFQMVAPKGPGKDAILGSAIHCCYLTPKLFAEEYVRGENFDRRTKYGKEQAAFFSEQHAGQIVLEPEDFEKVEAVTESLLNHPKVQDITGGALKEISVVWHNQLAILDCKGRPDLFVDECHRVLDLKTTSKPASKYQFLRSVIQRGYHRQAAAYLEGLQECGNQAKEFVFIVAETLPPYEIAFYDLDKEFLMVAQNALQELRIAYRQCKVGNNWPSYPSEVQTLACPNWLKSSPNLPLVEDY